MTWNNYKTWLENNNVVEEEISDIPTGNHILTNQATTKYLGASYSEDQEKELSETINNLMLSLQATIDDDDSVYHLLPNYDKEKNWEALTSSDIKLGKNNLLNTNKISSKVYTILARMFNEWQSSQDHEETEEEKQEKLEEKLEKTLNDNPIDKETEELAGYSFLGNLSPKIRKEFLTKWETWLSDYEQLTEERQQHFKREKSQVEKLVKVLKNSAPEKEKVQEGNWLTNLPWNNIALYGGGLVIILFVWNWLKAQIKE